MPVPENLQPLFTPLKLGDVTIKNRITMSALTRNRAENTYPTNLMREYYVQRADAGLIVSEGILIVRQGTEWPHAPGIWDDKQVEGWKKIVDGVHEAGGKIYAQLWHDLPLIPICIHSWSSCTPDMPEQKLAGSPVYAPSAISARGGKFRILPGTPGYVTPTEIDDPRKIIAEFKQAAINAKKAGFDGVELHGANGYIVHQFLDSSSNKRTDEWGGSKENRARFALETLKALQEVYGKNVSVKVSPAGGYNDMGMPIDETLDTYKYYFAELDKLGLSYITLVRYLPIFDATFDGVLRATQHDVLGSYRPVIKNTPVLINGGVLPEEGAELVASGKVDAISIGFNFITHSDLVKRMEHGKPLDNVPDIQHLQTNKHSGDWSTGYTDYPLAVY
ncbi:flavoprotein NADH-dependent oxidoreductase [Gymnopilus junonius]|uniref:Flavoprotein NADH-dependent oxidoreductase n=1 Tax=Gymnopilus junonius TaxID=109634 RepID=A0A9P5NE13_GYMJU|nr:flavoprotein NADH-dependent oxidoreductase [Gymnopilus junonius]